MDWASLTSLIAAGVCLYVAGNFLNDWMDRGWDRQHRPERALPRGLFTPGNYLTLAVIFAAAGTALAFSTHRLAGATALCILLFIVIYTIWHKRSPWMVIPMGLCRALLPIMGALGMLTVDLNAEILAKIVVVAALAGGALFFYIAGLSLSARGETNPARSTSVKALSLVCFLITALMIFPLSLPLQISGWWWLAPVPYLVWWIVCQTRCRRPISKYVSALLAGIPLIDCITLIPLALWMLTGVDSNAAAQPLAIISLILPPLAVLFALALQRLAPAT